MTSTITATQKFSAIHPIIRVNATELFIYRLRNYKDLETFIEEVSAVYDKKGLLALYNAATEEPFSFLYVKLTSKSKDDMFYKRFDHKLTVVEGEELKKRLITIKLNTYQRFCCFTVLRYGVNVKRRINKNTCSCFAVDRKNSATSYINAIICYCGG